MASGPPPPFDQAPLRRKRVRTGMWIILAICTFGCVCPVFVGGLLFPVFAQAREAADASVCRQHMRLVGDAILEYEVKHGQFPKTAEEAVTEAAIPNSYELSCPRAKLPGLDMGYAYNASTFAGRKPEDMNDEELGQPVLVEVAEDEPHAVLTRASMFSRRHLRGKWVNAFFYRQRDARLQMGSTELAHPILDIKDFTPYTR